SIKDVAAADLRGFTQCHFFAGIAVWPYALRLAGWPNERECWTGSCPCPSFSCAGKGEGFDDPRHLWPEFYRLIGECKPAAVFGEQSADAIGHGWWDLVSTDLESSAYAVAAAVLSSAGVGGSDKRHRLYFVGLADAEHPQRRPKYEEHTETHRGNGFGRSGNTMPIICDGCSVREPWEHRCHGSNSYVNGERTGLSCECPDCSDAGRMAN